MPNQALPELLTPTETAQALGVQPSTLAIWRTTGRYNLPFVKSGRGVRYKKTDVMDFLERRTKRFEHAGA
ncbi:MAG: helix-turn-helix domain-containing protein [Candidatus Competibacteraceae bacterium]|nr:helix-turn-helix domain-containing protein [Candidatus Competibacteraceae bacterium]